jgi:hypothetical protein
MSKSQVLTRRVGCELHHIARQNVVHITFIPPYKSPAQSLNAPISGDVLYITKQNVRFVIVTRQ